MSAAALPAEQGEETAFPDLMKRSRKSSPCSQYFPGASLRCDYFATGRRRRRQGFLQIESFFFPSRHRMER